MARGNKYTSLNFNHIFDKPNNNTSSSPSSPSTPHSLSSKKSYSLSASSRHGGMLLLSRPSPSPSPTKALPSPSPPLSPSPDTTTNNSISSSTISLRPQGTTGSNTPELKRVASPENGNVGNGKFVPPHLRPGYVAREAVPPPGRPKSGHGHFGHGRPNSGGGGGFDPGYPIRPRSGGGGMSRPSSTG